ncbi:MAG: DUF2911 domain-containing protein [Reichenbachiella sp.]
MKKFNLNAVLALSLSLLLSTGAMAQIDTPRPSPAGSASSTIGLTDIEVSYFRPKMKGRKIFGEADVLLPYGKRWRAGANSGTVITFSTDVTVAGTAVPAGEYLLILTPGASEWEVILYSDKSLGSNVDKAEEDKITVKVNIAAGKLTETVETLTYQIADISENSENANIQMAWENTVLNIPVQVSFDETIMKAIAENTVVNTRNLLSAANYYYSADKDLDQALIWVNTYLAEGENGTQFWNVHLKAQILAKQGNKKEAIKTAKASKELAENFEAGDFGYIKRNDDLIASLK